MNCVKVGTLLLIAVFVLTEGNSEVKHQATSKFLDALCRPFATLGKMPEDINNLFNTIDSLRPHIPKKVVEFLEYIDKNKPHIPEKINELFENIENNRPHIPQKILEILQNIDNGRPHIARKIIEFLLYIDKIRPHLFLRILKKIRQRVRHAIAKRPLLGRLLKVLDKIRYTSRGYVVKVLPRINTSYLEETKGEEYEEEEEEEGGEPDEEIGASNGTEVTNATVIEYVPYVETTTKGPIVLGRFFNRVVGDLFNVYYRLL